MEGGLRVRRKCPLGRTGWRRYATAVDVAVSRGAVVFPFPYGQPQSVREAPVTVVFGTADLRFIEAGERSNDGLSSRAALRHCADRL
jgi:hypothetical protein